MAKEIVNGVHDYSDADQYIYPESPVVRKHLEWFSGLKLGFMMHWLPGCQIASYESWPLSDGDGEWSQEDVDWTDDIEEFKKQYRNCNKTFNPIKFRPDRWAKLAKECGFQYLLFTTKHHDGFCMFDTQTTDYKITAETCPFHTNPNADIVGSLFDAFRSEGMAISAYFSKPDWNSPYYWSPDFPKAATRNVNYTIKEHPALWEQFIQFTHQQMLELTSRYGKIDTLWLDGGWVRPDNEDQDIRLGEVVEKIRANTQPHLIVCDRTVGGPYENIITPEQNIPPTPLPVPWETCMSLGRYFSFHYSDEYKPARMLVHTLIEIVAKGGSLALNVTPQPDGKLPMEEVHILRQLGRWMAVNGEGIYHTHIAPVSFGRKVAYTQKDHHIYAFYLYGEHPYLPPKVYLDVPYPVQEISLLRTGQTVAFSQQGNKVVLDTAELPMLDAEYSDCFRIAYQQG